MMLTVKDDDVLGMSNAMDGMGVLAIWTTRGRDLVPHLTAQTNSARGLRLVVEIFALWEPYRDRHPEHADRVSDFSVLVEQIFARLVGRATGDWPLPGKRRVLGRLNDRPRVSISDPSWHLLASQRGNGLWGLYRGAAGRAGLLDPSLEALMPPVLEAIAAEPMISGAARNQLFDVVREGLEGRSPDLETDGRNALFKAVKDGFAQLPAADLLWRHVVETDSLTSALAHVLVGDLEMAHREALLETAERVPEHRTQIDDAIRCENFLAVVEAIFFYLCHASRGATPLTTVVAELPVDPDDLTAAQDQFSDSGRYEGVAALRHRWFRDDFDCATPQTIVESVLDLHERISASRGRARWVWKEDARIVGDMDLDIPDDDAFEVGVAWRNDYFLTPLRSVAAELALAM